MKQHFSTAFSIFALLLASIAVVNSYDAWSSDEQPAKAAPLKEADIPLCPIPRGGWCRNVAMGVEVEPASKEPRTEEETRKLPLEPRKVQVAGRLAELERHAHVIPDNSAAFLIARHYQPDTILKRPDTSSANPARWCVQCIGDKPCEECPSATVTEEVAK